MKQYLKLLMVREGKEVLGHKGANLWLLTIVLVATFVSIAFSKGSMLYLQDKMEDPFTNWVSINKAVDNERFNAFRTELNSAENKARFDYSNVRGDQYADYNIMGTDEKHIRYLTARFFEDIHSPLVKAILNESNIARGCVVDSSVLVSNTMGFIITVDAAKRLGYEEDALPAYINYLANQDNERADSLGIELVMDDFYPIPLPVLAVVRRLPGNVDMMSANFFYEQQHLNDHTHPFSFVGHEEYRHHLNYFVPEDISLDEVKAVALAVTPDTLKEQLSVLANKELLPYKSWKPGQMVDVTFGDAALPASLYESIAGALASGKKTIGMARVHNLNTEEHPSERSEYISVEFNSLNHIREFESFAKGYGIQLEMSQVASKENFNAVTVMGGILSAAMVVFSLVCIIMFLVNMLQSYFQKVKRNLGTFKAFGMNARELIYVYTIILILIVSSAVIMALLITWFIQTVLPAIGVEKDGFNYLSLWNGMTYAAALIIVFATVATVSVVMSRMLSQTPGDLIYDRN